MVLTRLDYGNATLAARFTKQSAQVAQQTPVCDECSRTPHGLYSRHGSPSTSHRCSVTFTGYGCGLSLNSLCSPSAACTAWLMASPYPARELRRVADIDIRITTTTALRVDICPRRAIDASCYHWRPRIRRRRCACLEHCWPTSRHRHHCLSSSDI